MMRNSVRYPAVAGQFYPADKAVLQDQINSYLDRSEKIINHTSEIINLLIVPHAGYDYSGAVAAAGFKQIKNQRIKRVILIGCSHQTHFEGAAIDDNDFWLTPLGKVPVDKKFAESLDFARDNKIFFSSKPHIKEHSLEVQLPFLQTVLKDFKIVPILLGKINNLAIQQLARLIARLNTRSVFDEALDGFNTETLIIISSDLSHYPPYDIANQVDNETTKSILSGDINNFEQTISKQMACGYENLVTCACANTAIKLGMAIASKFTFKVKGKYNTLKVNAAGWRLIKYANSGDVSGIKDQVVGYAAIAFSLPSF